MIFYLLLFPFEVDTIYNSNTFKTRHFPIIVESELIYTYNDTLFRNKDYQIGYDTGIIKFSKPHKLVFVYYKYLPIHIPLTYQDWVIKKKKPVFYITKDKKPSKSPLSLTGTKSFFIDADTRGISFDQATNIRISGKVQGLNISGVLSDENLPETGVSLREINRVYIDAEGKNTSIRMGDIDIPYLNRKKEVIGGYISAHNFTTGFGLNKGIFIRNEFYGQSDVQGPYILNGKNGERVNVIEGSEKVYLNGNLMKKGREEDYIIDYDNGEISFTPKHPISHSDKITVEFEYLIGQWRRYTFFGGVKKNNNGISLIQEEDVYDDSLIKNIVRTTDSLYVWVDNGKYVGYNKGYYVKFDSIYIYKGYHRGDYDVDFRYEGEGKGDYIYDYSLGGFRYVGIGNGAYTARRKFILPSRKRGVQLTIDKGYSFFHIIALGRVNSTQRYIVPMRQNGGFFHILPEFRLGRIFTLSTNVYSKYDNYQPFGDECGNELLSNYEFFGVPDKVLEGKATLNYKILQVNFEKGNLWSGDTALDRVASKITLLPLSVSYQWVNGTFNRETGNIVMGSDKNNIYGEYYALNKIGKRKGGIHLGNRFGSLNIFSGWEFGNGRDTATIQGGNIGWKMKSGYLDFTYRGRKPLKTGKNETVLAFSNGISFSGKHLSLHINTDVSRKFSALWEEVYQEVSSGEGDYSYDSLTQNYYPDPYGNYIRMVYQTDKKASFYGLYSYASVETRGYPLILGVNGMLNRRGSLYTKEEVNGKMEYPVRTPKSVFLDLNLRKIDDKMGYSDYKRNLRLGVKWKKNPARDFGALLKNQRSYEWKGIFWGLRNSGMINGGMDGEFLRNIKKVIIYNFHIKPYIRLMFNQNLISHINIEITYNRYGTGTPETETRYLYPEGITYTTYPSMDFDINNKAALHITGYYRIIPRRESQYSARMEIESKF